MGKAQDKMSKATNRQIINSPTCNSIQVSAKFYWIYILFSGCCFLHFS